MRGLVLLLATSLAGCAPLASFRPASGLMDDRSIEIGGGGVIVGPRRFVEEPVYGAGQAWVSGRPRKGFTLSGIAAAEANALAAGGALRYDVIRTDRFIAGPEVSLGFLWGSLDLCAAVRVFDQTYIYTAPRFGNRGATWALDVPAGLSVRVYGGLMLRAEYRSMWTGELSYTQRRDVAGAAVAYQF